MDNASGSDQATTRSFRTKNANFLALKISWPRNWALWFQSARFFMHLKFLHPPFLLHGKTGDFEWIFLIKTQRVITPGQLKSTCVTHVLKFDPSIFCWTLITLIFGSKSPSQLLTAAKILLPAPTSLLLPSLRDDSKNVRTRAVAMGTSRLVGWKERKRGYLVPGILTAKNKSQTAQVIKFHIMKFKGQNAPDVRLATSFCTKKFLVRKPLFT